MDDFLKSLDPILTVVVFLVVSSTAAMAWLTGRDNR